MQGQAFWTNERLEDFIRIARERGGKRGNWEPVLDEFERRHGVAVTIAAVGRAMRHRGMPTLAARLGQKQFGGRRKGGEKPRPRARVEMPPVSIEPEIPIDWEQEEDPLAAEIADAAQTEREADSEPESADPTPSSAPLPKRVPEATDHLREHRLRVSQSELQETNRRLLKELHDKDAQLTSMGILRAAGPIPPVVAARGRGEGTQRLGCPVMLCSDWHVEEPVDPAKVNGLNVYNLDIADRCIDAMADAYVWLSNDPRYDCRTGVVWLGGDLFSGWIHEELMQSNFLSPNQATLWLQDRIERMLRKILAEMPNLERLIVPCNDGNHGRLTHKMRVSTRTENSLEWLMYHNLAHRLKDEKRLEFHIAEGEFLYVKVFETALGFFHGDSVRYQGGVGGLGVPMNKAAHALRQYTPFDVLNFGHFHTRLDLPSLTGNGSMIGTTPYGLHIKATPEPRQQSFYIVDSTRGKCISAPIWLPSK